MTDTLKQQLTHLTGGRLNDEELEDLAGFVLRAKADARREGYLTLASLLGKREEAERVIETLANGLTRGGHHGKGKHYEQSETGTRTLNT